jgi:hypothetical protein
MRGKRGFVFNPKEFEDFALGGLPSKSSSVTLFIGVTNSRIYPDFLISR